MGIQPTEFNDPRFLEKVVYISLHEKFEKAEK